MCCTTLKYAETPLSLQILIAGSNFIKLLHLIKEFFSCCYWDLRLGFPQVWSIWVHNGLHASKWVHILNLVWNWWCLQGFKCYCFFMFEFLSEYATISFSVSWSFVMKSFTILVFYSLYCFSMLSCLLPCQHWFPMKIVLELVLANAVQFLPLPILDQQLCLTLLLMCSMVYPYH